MQTYQDHKEALCSWGGCIHQSCIPAGSYCPVASWVLISSQKYPPCYRLLLQPSSPTQMPPSLSPSSPLSRLNQTI